MGGRKSAAIFVGLVHLRSSAREVRIKRVKMSAMDKVRSFAETRTEDDWLLPGGCLSYGDARKVMGEYYRLRAEVERLNKLSTCRCGDGFTLTYPGTCGNCLATYYQDRVLTGTVMATVGRPAPPRVSPLSRAVEPKTEAEEPDPLQLPSY